MLPISESTAATHPDLEDLLLLQSGELDSQSAVSLQDHLDHCARCRERMAATASLYSRVALAGSKQAPADKGKWPLGIVGVSVLVVCFGIVAAVRYNGSTPAAPVVAPLPIERPSAPVRPSEIPPETLPPRIDVPALAVDPRDRAEAQMRLALRRLTLDASTLIAVERTKSSIRLVGVVPDDAVRQSIRLALEDPSLIAIRTELEEQREPQPLPWQSFQGDRPPLAAEHLRALYPSNSPERQRWQNRLDLVTRELVGMAGARHGLLQLVGRRGIEDQSVALRQAATEIDAEMMRHATSLADELAPLLGAQGRAVATRPLTPAAAERLYVLVHDLVFLGRAASLPLEETMTEVRSLLYTPAQR